MLLVAFLAQFSRQTGERPAGPDPDEVLRNPLQTFLVQIIQAVGGGQRQNLQHARTAAGARFVEIVTVALLQCVLHHFLQALQAQHVGQGGQFDQTDGVRHVGCAAVYVTQGEID